jgi:membrane-bound serine protease (ClpP class)
MGNKLVSRSRWCLLGVVGALLLALALLCAPRPSLAAQYEMLVLDIDTAIGPAQDELLANAAALAEARHDALVIRLDTPGGLAETMRSMVQTILNANVPVLIWVGPSGARAASAGIFLVAAGDVAAMSPQTTIGSATPVQMSGEDVPEAMSRKIMNDMISLVRGVAGSRGRNVDWYIKAIEESDNLTASEAAMNNVVDYLAADVPDLLDQAGARGLDLRGQSVTFSAADVALVPHEPGLRYTLLSWLFDPQIAYFLLLGGLAGIFFELTSPGAIFPGVLGGLCLLLAFYSLSILPTSAAGLLLILFGLVLFLLEIKITSYGLLGIAAVVGLFIGSLLLFPEAGPFGRLPLQTIIITVSSISILLGAIVILAAKAQFAKPASGMESLVGCQAEVRTWEGDQGLVFVQGALWTARSQGETYQPGDTVTIFDSNGLTVHVRK